jgi:hypothetical protein
MRFINSQTKRFANIFGGRTLGKQFIFLSVLASVLQLSKRSCIAMHRRNKCKEEKDVVHADDDGKQE